MAKRWDDDLGQLTESAYARLAARKLDGKDLMDLDEAAKQDLAEANANDALPQVKRLLAQRLAIATLLGEMDSG